MGSSSGPAGQRVVHWTRVHDISRVLGRDGPPMSSEILDADLRCLRKSRVLLIPETCRRLHWHVLHGRSVRTPPIWGWDRRRRSRVGDRTTMLSAGNRSTRERRGRSVGEVVEVGMPRTDGWRIPTERSVQKESAGCDQCASTEYGDRCSGPASTRHEPAF